MVRRKSPYVTSRQHEVLLLLSRSASCSIGEIVSTLGISYAAATKMIDRLADKGLVQRSTNEMDRRFTDVSLTPAGIQAARILGSLPGEDEKGSLMKHKQDLPLAPQQTYLPATSDVSLVFEQSLRNIPIVARDKPDRVCGVARRVGRTGKGKHDPAIYRLKLKVDFASSKAATLPGFFVIENGVFVAFDEWSSRQTE
jgi:DNA-binding MarR family transcriptional regulator